MSADFMAACQFLKDHMDNMDNPNGDMVSSKSNLMQLIYWILKPLTVRTFLYLTVNVNIFQPNFIGP